MAITITPVAASGNGGVQNDYPLKQGEGRLGAIYDLERYVSRARIANGAIPFGVPLIRGGEDQASVWNGSAIANFIGFSLISDTFVPQMVSLSITGSADTYPSYPDNIAVNVLEKGTVWLVAANAVTQDSPVALLLAASGLFATRGLAVAQGGTADSVNIPGARFMRSAAAGVLVPVALDVLPN
jgi:hypothetical protein